MGSISLKGVNKVFPDGTVAVKNVDLDIDDGEFVVFVGPSGCGKSTLLRMIAGLEPLSDGEMRIGGEVINELPPRDRDIAMVFQSYALYPHMTVRQNIGFALQQHGIPNAEIDRRVNEAARILDLSNLLNRKPKELSGGQRQRVAMGRAIVRHPKAFLLDEPLSNLDAKLRVLMRAELGRLHARLGVTTIHVTHDQIEAMTLGNRIAVFSAGALQQYDTPHALYGNPVNIFVAGFIGSPAMNFLEATVIGTGDAASLSIGTSTVPLHPLPEGAHVATGDKVIVGIRPEHLLWLPAGAGSQTGLRARVELVERIEPESFVVASLTDPTIVIRTADDFVKTRADDEPELARSDARLVTMRLNADKVPDRGSSIDIVIDVDRIHLFDSRTGKNLRMAAGSPA